MDTSQRSIRVSPSSFSRYRFRVRPIVDEFAQEPGDRVCFPSPVLRMNRSSPAISILLPVYNPGAYLRGALDSVIKQSMHDWELIAVDDGSTDRSHQVLTAYAWRDPRIRVISRANSGIVDALNEGLAAARGKYIARMDADDLALPVRLAAQHAFLQENASIVGCGTAVYVIDDTDAVVDLMPRPQSHAEIDAALLKGDGGALIHPSTLFRAETLRAVGGYRKPAQFTEDLDLYLRLAEVGQLANLAEPHLCYRIHFKSTNFAQAASKAKIKRWVMEDACRRRGIAFQESQVALRHFQKTRGDFHREWAGKSLAFGGVRTPLRHALAACLAEPRQRQSWRMLAYVVRQLRVRSAAVHPRPALAQ